MTADDGPVEVARALVAADLADPRWDAALDAAADHRRWWVQQWPDGAEHVLGLLAQDAQEAVHGVDPQWPPCREPSCEEVGRHALFIEPDLGPDPFWVCERTGLPVAPVGRLNG